MGVYSGIVDPVAPVWARAATFLGDLFDWFSRRCSILWSATVRLAVAVGGYILNAITRTHAIFADTKPILIHPRSLFVSLVPLCALSYKISRGGAQRGESGGRNGISLLDTLSHNDREDQSAIGAVLKGWNALASSMRGYAVSETPIVSHFVEGIINPNITKAPIRRVWDQDFRRNRTAVNLNREIVAKVSVKDGKRVEILSNSMNGSSLSKGNFNSTLIPTEIDHTAKTNPHGHKWWNLFHRCRLKIKRIKLDRQLSGIYKIIVINNSIGHALGLKHFICTKLRSSTSAAECARPDSLFNRFISLSTFGSKNVAWGLNSIGNKIGYSLCEKQVDFADPYTDYLPLLKPLEGGFSQIGGLLTHISPASTSLNLGLIDSIYDMLEQFKSSFELGEYKTFGPLAEHCMRCWVEPFVYLSLAITLLAMSSGQIRSLVYKVRHTPYALPASIFAFALWHPILLGITSAMTILKFGSLSDVGSLVNGYGSLSVITISIALKLLEAVVNTFSYHFLSCNPIPPLFPEITPKHLSVILPYPFKFRKQPTLQYKATLNSILATGTKDVILFSSSLEAQSSALKFVQAYDRDRAEILKPVFSQTAVTGAERFLSAAKEVRTPFVAFVEEANVYWQANFLREALSAFENPLIGIVGTAIEPVEFYQYKEDPWNSESIKQKVLRYFASSKTEKYNFKNTATSGIDGGVSPLSRATLLIRTEILQSPQFRTEYLKTNDNISFLTRFVQNAGFKTIFLNDSKINIRALPPSATQHRSSLSFISFLNISIRERRKDWRHTLRSLLLDRMSYRNYPWSAFSIHLSKLLDLPAKYGGVILLMTSSDIDDWQYICPLIVSLSLFKVVQNAISLRRNPSTLGLFLLSMLCDLLLDPLVGFYALLTAWK